MVAWVGFWAFYGQGFGAENLAQVASFAVAYASVILIEPVLDLAVLAAAKSLHGLASSKAFHARLYRAALAPPARGADATAELQAELSRLSEASGGVLGVSALHLESGERIRLRASERFPMADSGSTSRSRSRSSTWWTAVRCRCRGKSRWTATT